MFSGAFQVATLNQVMSGSSDGNCNACAGQAVCWIICIIYNQWVCILGHGIIMQMKFAFEMERIQIPDACGRRWTLDFEKGSFNHVLKLDLRRFSICAISVNSYRLSRWFELELRLNVSS